MTVLSPLTGSSNVKLESTIETGDIIDAYLKIFHTDVARFFEGIEKMQVYKCLDTNYRFYYPFTVSGDGNFYQALQKFDWYYMNWKWEHSVALRYIKPGNKVLEVGCAKGSFIERLFQSGVEATGLELNEAAATEGKKRGLDVRVETVQHHASQVTSTYDVVCSFQVVEHISDVKKVLQASIDLLKTGGKLIISVPNNDSFLGMDKNYLNMPPHHMGLWNISSLLSLENIFNIKMESIQLEPLQFYHKDYFCKTIINHYAGKYTFMAKIFRKLGPFVIPRITSWFPAMLKAYTVQAVYEKK